MSSADFNPNIVDLDFADPTQVICYLNSGGNDYDGRLGARVSALFVILIISTAVTFFPVLAKRVKSLKIPKYVYLFARYFGAGVIIATAFIHLLNPAYAEIGPQTCVGMTGHWADYSWCPAIVLVSVIVIFLLDFGAERYVEVKYGPLNSPDVEEAVTGQNNTTQQTRTRADIEMTASAQAAAQAAYLRKFTSDDDDDDSEITDPEAADRSFKQ